LDEEKLCGLLEIDRGVFESKYCRQVSLGIVNRVSLKEKSNLDCIFWEGGGCSVYTARPLQCRSFPFWSSNLSSKTQWEEIARQCPGVGEGCVHSRREIQQWLRMRIDEGLLEA
jgi:Fe-S-cluster containining protein